MTEILRPKTFYEWLLLLKANKLKLGPLEGIRESLVHHALSPKDRNYSHGFWDHQANTGFIDLVGEFRGERPGTAWDVLTK